ncbi:hypothetical protein CAEBREN_29928 [Caenorhabditis brenneri]|uniref:Uncharacterized protein n=1 Tax=Caenorhabditis brenneri TaxID=135651 RepID=G0P4C7_CAEBE|nr:hypothetical protein CAEBREN_29928 [Caenorhabditis brenneri]
MVLIFAIVGILFSSWELIARPFVHNYNGGFIYFSLNTWLQVSKEFIVMALVIYASFYIFILSLIAVQFVFRYLTLVNPRGASVFGGKGTIHWVSYSFVSATIYGSSLFIFGQSDDFSDVYMK